MSSFLSSISELEESTQASEDDMSCLSSPVIVQTKKRQRRLTLTAMTGALGDIPQDAPSNDAAASEDAASSGGWGRTAPPPQGGQQPLGGVVFVTPRTRTRSDASSGGASATQSPASATFKLAAQTPEAAVAPPCAGLLGAMPSPARGHLSGARPGSAVSDHTLMPPPPPPLRDAADASAPAAPPHCPGALGAPPQGSPWKPPGSSGGAGSGYGPMGGKRSSTGGAMRRPRWAEVGGGGLYGGGPAASAGGGGPFAASGGAGGAGAPGGGLQSPVGGTAFTPSPSRGVAFTPPPQSRGTPFQSPAAEFTPLRDEHFGKASWAPSPAGGSAFGASPGALPPPPDAMGPPRAGPAAAAPPPALPGVIGGAAGAAGGCKLSRSPAKQPDEDTSPKTGPCLLPGFKRTRDSIGPDLSPEVMMRRAAQKFVNKPSLKRSASSSSNSDEDEMAYKSQRRATAFEYGLKAAEGPGAAENWATTVGVGVALSPRSFARGCKAAEVAARVEEQMRRSRCLEAERAAEQQARIAQSSAPPAPDAASPKKRPNPLLLRKASGS